MHESILLEHIYATNALLGKQVTIPPGDDMGAIQIGGEEVLITVDQLLDGVHFQLSKDPIGKIAKKAITRNLSDVAAMGGLPVAAVAAGCIPHNFRQEQAEILFDTMRNTAEKYQCPLIGGDIATGDQPLNISVTVMATMKGIPPMLRCGAQIGDVICVTGQLGGSQHSLDGYTHHLDFEPRLQVARMLATHHQHRPNCMIDLSDGLASDLAHLCRAASLSATVDEKLLPFSKTTALLADQGDHPKWKHAVSDGEDYELCFTMTPSHAEGLIANGIDGVPVTCIGMMEPSRGESIVRIRLPDKTYKDITDLGWQHIGQPEPS